jgi:4-hydroxy-3-polyprenylbenzoate decarboxylase
MEYEGGGKKMTQVNDLRSALARLKEMDGQLLETDIEVDPAAELSGVYRHVGAGGTVMRPTQIDGPAMLFNNVKGHPDAKVLIGLLASRQRVATLFDCKKEDLGKLLCEAAKNPIQPVVSQEMAPCQEVVHRSSDPDFDLFRLIPAPTNTPVDAGPYITMGMCYATHPDTGLSDVTIHRMCIQSKDELSIFLQPGSRHIGAMAERATELGQTLPISISIGVDPAIEVGSCFEPPTTPLGYNELSIAGAIRQTPVVLTPCVSIKENAIASAEYVIEGEIQPGVKVVEDQNSHTGYAMPEFPGYNGKASNECWLIKVTAVTHRKDPIMQTVIGPSEEHVNLAGIPTEASIYNMIDKALPGKVTNVYAHPAGGGKYMAVLQCSKTVHTDEGKQRQAALLAFSAFPELKHVILVDEDVDIFDSRDVLWAMNTRFQGDRDIITIPGVRCHPLDPSSDPVYDPSILDRGISCKTIFDCTVPFALKDQFHRAHFMDIDEDKWKTVLP